MSGVDGSDPPDHGDGSAPTCPHCRELADQVADLKSRLAAARSEPCAHPPFALEAVRLETRSWAEGWVLRPSPSQRAWMTATPFSYQCLPLVIANQWGWQVLCPTDVQVTWDGSPEPGWPPHRRRPAIHSRRAEPVRIRDRHLQAPLAIPDPSRLGPLCQGPEQPLEDQLRVARRGDRDLVAQIPVHLELEARRAWYGHLRGGRAWASSCRCRTRRFRTHRPERLPSRPSIPSSSLNCSGGMRNGSVSPTSRSGSTFAIAGRMRSRSISSKFRFHRSPPPAMAFRKRWPMLPSSDPCPLFRSPTGDRGEKQKDGTTESTASLLHIVPSLERA